VEQTLLKMTRISKHFAGTQALADVDFTVERGEVHALLGQNGAGKSTLIKILAGVYEADGGEILVAGRRANPTSDQLPIAFIHQDLGLFAPMTVAENVAMAIGYPQRNGLISWHHARRAATAALQALGSHINPDTTVADLQAAERSIVAIARALAIRADILILDEPTSTLPAPDVDHLIASLHRLRSQRIGIVYVTHRLDEVFRVADRVTVLRDGRRVATMPVAETSPDDLIVKIIGRKLAAVRPPDPPLAAPTPLLDVKEARVGRIGPVSFTLSAGESLGLVGLHGAGQTAVGRAIFGDRPLEAGAIILEGRKLAVSSPREAIAAGVSLVPGNRLEEAAIAEMSVRENIFLNPWVGRHRDTSWINPQMERLRAATKMRQFTVRPPRSEAPLLTLSGGNQQKVILARWIREAVRLLILEEPTSGVDVGAKAEIYGLLAAAQSHGMAVLVISSDFEEIERACQRALVFNRGEIIKEVSGSEVTPAVLTRWATLARDHSREMA
jgi:ribose transport system ATP-binding protein